MKKSSVAILISFLAVLAFAVAANAGGAIVVGGNVWLDENLNATWDEASSAGVNDIRVNFIRDYDCNGIVDGADEFYDYSYTHDNNGLPGFYSVSAVGGFCFVVKLDETELPTNLVVTTEPEVAVATSSESVLDIDFGIANNSEVGDDDDDSEETWDVLLGGHVWNDSNNNGIFDEGLDTGINDVRVDFMRDYDCNGLVDGSDELYDYDYTTIGSDGNPGFYSIIASSKFCYVAVIDLTTVPEGMTPTTATKVPVQYPPTDKLDINFGLSVPYTPEFTCPKTIGFWKQQFLGGHASKYTYGELSMIVMNAMTLTDLYHNFFEFGYYLNVHGRLGMLAKALRQFAALTLNLAAYDVLDYTHFKAGLSPETPLDLPSLTDAATVGEAFDEIEYYIRTGTNLGLANDLADAINNGVGIEVDCAL